MEEADMRYSHLNGLPQEITLNIFSRLPSDSVLDCKKVCRAWRNLIRFHANTTYFAYQHLKRHHGFGLSSQQHSRELHHIDGSDSPPMSFVFLGGRGREQLYYAEYHEDDEITDKQQPHWSTKRFNINFNFLEEDVCQIVGSCNGLICLSSANSEPFYICNPITRESVNLPVLSINNKKHNRVVRIARGFGYHPLTNEYKVIRISYIYKTTTKGRVEVYTLGSGSGWRYIGKTSYDLCWQSSEWETTSGVCLNGAIYWLHLLHDNSLMIVAFDLLREDFQVFPTPIGPLPVPYLCSLRVMRGSLCYVSAYYEDNVLMSDFSFLRKNKEEIKKLYHKSWSMPNLRGESIVSFAVTRRGEILLARFGVVSLYDVAARNEKDIWKSRHQLSWVVPVLHINSFVSLKALGERSAKMSQESPHDIRVFSVSRRGLGKTLDLFPLSSTDFDAPLQSSSSPPSLSAENLREDEEEKYNDELTLCLSLVGNKKRGESRDIVDSHNNKKKVKKIIDFNNLFSEE